jgi:hypothetical protein
LFSAFVENNVFTENDLDGRGVLGYLCSWLPLTEKGIPMRDAELLDRVWPDLKDLLEGIPGVAVSLMRPPLRKLGQVQPALLIKVKTRHGPRTLLVEVGTSGSPKNARAALNQLARFREVLPEALGVFAAPFISPATIEICKSEGVGAIDLAGNCYLAFNEVFIRVTGRDNPAPNRRGLRSIFTPKSSRVLRVLLANPGRHWMTQALATEAKVSLGLVFNVKERLLDREWVKSEPEGLLLVEPSLLLKDWAVWAGANPPLAQHFYSMESIPGIEARLAKACRSLGVPCALTGFSAADRLAPFTRYSKATAYVIGSADPVVVAMNVKPVSSGGNVELLVTDDQHILYGAKDLNDVKIVSPVQAYLDLQSQSGRGLEAAEFLLQEVISKQW